MDLRYTVALREAPVTNGVSPAGGAAVKSAGNICLNSNGWSCCRTIRWFGTAVILEEDRQRHRSTYWVICFEFIHKTPRGDWWRGPCGVRSQVLLYKRLSVQTARTKEQSS
jgi:hypothetical protein